MMSVSSGPTRLETIAWTTANDTPVTSTAGRTSRIRRHPARTTMRYAGMMIENRGSWRPTIADRAMVVEVGSVWPRTGATSRPRVTTGMPIEPNATGAVLASRDRTAAVTGSKPRLARIEAEIATGAPKPAMPSMSAPKLKATSSACKRRSVVRRLRARLITSKSPLATVRLWKKTAFRTNQLELPELGGVDAMALERLEFIDSRLLDRNAAWNGALPTYQLLPALVSIPSNAFDQRSTQPKTIA